MITFSLPIPSEAQAKETRICWQLITSAPQESVSPYALDDVYFLTSLPSPIDYVLQFRLNFGCESPYYKNKSSFDGDEYHVVVQYSTDHGHQWNSVHNLCLPPACSGVQSSIQVSEYFPVDCYLTKILSSAEYVFELRYFASMGKNHATNSVRCHSKLAALPVSSERWSCQQQVGDRRRPRFQLPIRLPWTRNVH